MTCCDWRTARSTDFSSGTLLRGRTVQFCFGFRLNRKPIKTAQDKLLQTSRLSADQVSAAVSRRQ